LPIARRFWPSPLLTRRFRFTATSWRAVADSRSLRIFSNNTLAGSYSRPSYLANKKEEVDHGKNVASIGYYVITECLMVLPATFALSVAALRSCNHASMSRRVQLGSSLSGWPSI